MMASTAPLIEEAREIVVRVAQDMERFEEIRKRLEGGAAFLGENPFPLPTPPWSVESGGAGERESPKGAIQGEPQSWADFVLKVLEGTDRGFTTSELMKRASSIGLEDFVRRYHKSGNGFFAAARILELKSEIVRVNGAIYLPSVRNRILAGELRDAHAERRVGGVARSVLDVLAEDGPMTAGEIIAAFKRRPDLAEIATERSNSIYANLHKLTNREDVVREGNVYRLPSQALPAAPNVTLFPGANHGQ